MVFDRLSFLIDYRFLQHSNVVPIPKKTDYFRNTVTVDSIVWRPSMMWIWEDSSPEDFLMA